MDRMDFESTVVNQMCPGTTPLPVGEGLIALATLSAAVSLKRIADRIDATTDWRYDMPAVRTRMGE